MTDIFSLSDVYQINVSDECNFGIYTIHTRCKRSHSNTHKGRITMCLIDFHKSVYCAHCADGLKRIYTQAHTCCYCDVEFSICRCSVAQTINIGEEHGDKITITR